MTTIDRLNVIMSATGGDKVSKEFRSLGARFSELGNRSISLRDSMGALAGAAGFGYVAKQAFDLGSTVEETGSKFRTVFGQSTKDVQAFVDSFGTMAGLSDEQAQAVLATTGSIVQGMGFAQNASAKFSTEVVKLAGDLSSFNNIPVAETARAIQAALTGEREQLKRLGIVLRETDVQQRALANSGKTSAAALTDQERATASLQLITERAGSAIGDLARTQDSAANQARALGAEVQNLKEDLSVALVPAFRVAVDWALKFIGGMKLLGVDTAVALARFRLAFDRTFKDDDAFKAALDNLHNTSLAAREMRLEILGLANDLGGLNNTVAGSGGGGAPSTIAALEQLQAGTEAASSVADRYVVRLRQEAVELNVVAAATGVAADETNRLADAQSRISSGLGALGGLGSLLGFAIPGLGQASTALGVFSGLRSAFGGGKAAGGPVSGGTSYMVGERGPELFVPDTAGTIVPNGGLTFNIPAAPDPMTYARDAQWQRAIAETFNNLRSNGYSTA